MKKIIRLGWTVGGDFQVAEVQDENNAKFYVHIQFGSINGISSVSSDANFGLADFNLLEGIVSDPTNADFIAAKGSLKVTAKSIIDLL
jgi:hypothetical protein